MDVTDNIHGTLNISSHGPNEGDGGLANTATNRLRITLTNFNSASQKRIAQIWLVNYGSKGLGSAYMLRSGGEMFGTPYPYNNNSYDLGTTTKK